jgi:alpha-tubulin suppressor-like RCC1 family protein
MCRQGCKYISQFYYGGQMPLFPHSSLFTAGSNSNGQLARDTDLQLFMPKQRSIGRLTASSRALNIGAADFGIVVRPSDTTSTSLGYYHTLIIDNQGTVFASGNNTYGQLGDNDGNFDQNPAVPVDTSGAMNGTFIKKVSAGIFHSLALSTDGQVFAWGRGDNGQLGQGDNNFDSNTPLLVSGGALAGKFITDISAGGYHSMALDSNGVVYTWGANASGQLGNGLTADSWTPVLVSNTVGFTLSSSRDLPVTNFGLPDPVVITGIAAGNRHSLANNKETGTVYAWGDNTFQQLGALSEMVMLLEPVVVANTGPGNILVVDIFSGSGANTSIGLDNAGIAYTWGDNSANQCGIVSIDSVILQPTAVDSTNLAGKVVKYAGSSVKHSILITNNEVFTTGDNDDGQRGTGMTGDHSDIFALVKMSNFPPGSEFIQTSAGGGTIPNLEGSQKSYSAVVVKYTDVYPYVRA